MLMLVLFLLLVADLHGDLLAFECLMPGGLLDLPDLLPIVSRNHESELLEDLLSGELHQLLVDLL